MIRTPIIFGKTEHVHIVSPDFFTLPKLNISVPDGVRVEAGYFVDEQGALLTLLTNKVAPYLVIEDTHDVALPGIPAKPGGVMTGYFIFEDGSTPFVAGNAISLASGVDTTNTIVSSMLVNTKIFDKGTPFLAGDKISLSAGIIVPVGITNTIVIGEIVEVGDTYISVTLNGQPRKPPSQTDQ